MSYLLDKKVKRKKLISAGLFVLICLALFYFKAGIWNGLSYAAGRIFHPVLVLGGDIGEKFSSLKFYFISKKSLYAENQNLKSQLAEERAMLSNYNSVLAENAGLREILGRKGGTPMVLAGVLGKPNRSLYDTLVIDAGAKEGLEAGDMVFALGNVPIGRVSDVYPDSAKAVLFSNPGERTQVMVGDNNIFLEAVGRGGGNFELIVPRDLAIVPGDAVSLPAAGPFVLAEVVTIISDPRDPYTKALLTSPVNIQELKFVQVEIRQ